MNDIERQRQRRANAESADEFGGEPDGHDTEAWLRWATASGKMRRLVVSRPADDILTALCRKYAVRIVDRSESRRAP